MKKIVPLVPLLATAAFACDYIDAASSDRPNATQRSAMGDIIEGIGGFVNVVADPESAADGDLVEMHRVEPLARILAPEGETSAALLLERSATLLPSGCVSREGNTVSWDCDFMSPAGLCTAIGSGTANADGTYSGSSAQCCPSLARDESGAVSASCAEAGGSEIIITAANLVFDQVAGSGGGSLRLAEQDHGSGSARADLAVIELAGIGFCTDEPTVAPNSGTLTVDGLGSLDGAAFDPLTIKFTDTPECGVALIE